MMCNIDFLNIEQEFKGHYKANFNLFRSSDSSTYSFLMTFPLLILEQPLRHSTLCRLPQDFYVIIIKITHFFHSDFSYFCFYNDIILNENKLSLDL